MEIQNMGEVGAFMHAPNKVASIVPVRAPNRLDAKHIREGDFTAPRYMLMASPGKK